MHEKQLNCNEGEKEMVRKIKKFFGSMLVAGAILSCTMTDDGSSKKLNTRKVPKRETVVVEENVVSDRKIIITGEDLYLNSDYIRSVIPSSRFRYLYRNDNSTADEMQFDNDELVDSLVKDFYEKASEEERLYFEENIDNIQLDVNVVLEADVKTVEEANIVKEMRAYKAGYDELYNNLGLTEVAVEFEETPNSRNNIASTQLYKLANYKKINRLSRYVNPSEQIVKSADLAMFFYINNNYKELKNINTLFKSDIDINKLIELKKIGDEVKVSSRNSKKSEDWFREKGRNGDVVSRGLKDSHPSKIKGLYGAYDHTGIFDRNKFDRKGKYSNCMLASYPVGHKFKKTSEKPDRLNYGAFEPLTNFIDNVNRFCVIRSRNNSGDKALQVAIDKYYGKEGKKSDYDPWGCGVYKSYVPVWHPGYIIHPMQGFYSVVSETIKLTHASISQPEDINYCSFISWYAYKEASNINLNSDTYNSNVGNMIVPDDIVKSGIDLYRRVWVGTRATGCTLFFGGGAGYYENKLIRKGVMSTEHKYP